MPLAYPFYFLTPVSPPILCLATENYLNLKKANCNYGYLALC